MCRFNPDVLAYITDSLRRLRKTIPFGYWCTDIAVYPVYTKMDCEKGDAATPVGVTVRIEIVGFRFWHWLRNGV